MIDTLGRYIFATSADGSITEFNCIQDYKYRPEGNTASSNTNSKEGWKPPIYDALTQTYQGPPTPKWSFIVSSTPPSNFKAIKVVSVLPDVFNETTLLYNDLTPSECAGLIRETEALNYGDCHGYHPQYRSNKRVIIMDDHLCQIIAERIKDYIPKRIVRGGWEWEFYGLNEALRFCRYTSGQHFSSHFDGYFERNSDERSSSLL